MNQLSLIVLSYNDAPSLAEVVNDMSVAAQSLCDDFEIIIVNDGSQDETDALAGKILLCNKHVRYIRHEVNRGVGAAFRSGVAAARFDLIGYVDGDSQYEPDDMVRLLAALSQADVASGVRVHRADPLIRSVISGVYNGCINILYDLSLKDVNSGFKIYRRHALEHIAPIESDGPFYDAEILIKVRAAQATLSRNCR